MKKEIIILVAVIFLSLTGYGKVYAHTHVEASYQEMHCTSLGGVVEYKLPDKTRVDCLTDEYAIEYDFAPKGYEAVGQSLYYALMTGKKPMIVLIKENEKNQKYINRILKVGEAYNIAVEYVTPAILKVDSYGRCSNKRCRCHKEKK